MIYNDILNSNITFKNLKDPEIVKKDGKKFVEAKIEWNKKEYTFKWCTGINDDNEIMSQVNSKIETMLALGFRYKLGEKTSYIKYNLNKQTVERRYDKGEPKISNLKFDEQVQHVAEKIVKLGQNPDKTALEKLENRKKRIEWTQKFFENLMNSTVSLKPAPKPENTVLKPIAPKSHSNGHHKKKKKITSDKPEQNPSLEKAIVKKEVSLLKSENETSSKDKEQVKESLI